jgi:hypothetical protein
MKRIISCLLFLSFISVSTIASTQVLPKGVIKADIYQRNFSIDTLGANPSGDRETWTEVKLTDGKISDIYLLKYVYDANVENESPLDIDLNTKLVNSWDKSITHFDFAYGLTKHITLFANISYEKATLDYTDEYVLASKKIDSSVVGELGNYTRVPEKATADNLNDTFVGLKFSPGPFAVAYKTTTGFLMTGHDSLEKKQSDGVQELETSRGYAQHHLYLFHNQKLLNNTLEFTHGYINLGKLTQNFLDIQNCDINPGDILLTKVNFPLRLSALKNTQLLDKMTLNSSYTFLYHRDDEIKGGNSAFSNTNRDPATKAFSDWTTMPDSSGITQMLDIELVYQPKIFLRAFAKGTFILSNTTTGQFYNFPGRIQPGNMLQFGVTLFAKNPLISGDN